MSGLGFLFPKRWPTAAELAAHAARMLHVRAATTVPTKLGIPTILDQGNSSACGGFDAVQCVHIWKQVNGIASVIGSPQFAYWNARRYVVHDDASIEDSGIDPDNMVMALADFGSCTLDDCPFSDDPTAINQKPGAVAYQNGQSVVCKLSPIFATGQDLVDAIKHVISVERKPVFGAIDVVKAYDNATNTNGVADDPSGDSRGGHAICFYGDDADGIWSAGSWGTGFGLHGSVLLTDRFASQRVLYAAGFEVLQ